MSLFLPLAGAVLAGELLALTVDVAWRYRMEAIDFAVRLASTVLTVAMLVAGVLDLCAEEDGDAETD